MKEIVKSYILYTLKTPNKLNHYVPNSHIGTIFSEVYEFIEYYESKDHEELFSKDLEHFSTSSFEDMVKEVFNENILTDEVIHNSYQLLREKNNKLRNIMKLLIILYNGKLMTKRVKRNMDKIYKEITKI